MTDFEALVQRLDDDGVRFIIVGGFAATILGSSRTTVDRGRHPDSPFGSTAPPWRAA